MVKYSDEKAIVDPVFQQEMIDLNLKALENCDSLPSQQILNELMVSMTRLTLDKIRDYSLFHVAVHLVNYNKYNTTNNLKYFPNFYLPGLGPHKEAMEGF
jgi:hypothetical protein